MSTLLDSETYYKSLPRKICSAVALLFNEQNHLLIVKPTYRDGWLLPGGTIEANESPRVACQREVLEEIGLDISISQLLCIDHIHAVAERPELLVFTFFGKTLSIGEIDCIKLPLDELSEYRFIAVNEIEQYLSPRQVLRLPHTLQAYQQQQIVYLEDGHPITI